MSGFLVRLFIISKNHPDLFTPFHGQKTTYFLLPSYYPFSVRPVKPGTVLMLF